MPLSQDVLSAECRRRLEGNMGGCLLSLMAGCFFLPSVEDAWKVVNWYLFSTIVNGALTIPIPPATLGIAWTLPIGQCEHLLSSSVNFYVRRKVFTNHPITHCRKYCSLAPKQCTFLTVWSHPLHRYGWFWVKPILGVDKMSLVTLLTFQEFIFCRRSLVA